MAPDTPALVTLRPTRPQTSAGRRENNKAAVLQQLYRARQSRADLARTLAMPRVRVSEIVAELLDEGMIEEAGTGPRAKVGKPATRLRVRDEAFAVFALDLSDETRFVGVVSDLRGRILYRTEVDVAGRTAADALDLAAGLVRRLLDVSDHAPLGVGVGVSGVVAGDHVTRVASSLGWGPTDVATAIRAEVSCDVHLINDANAAALGAYAAQEDSAASLLLVTTEHGIGAGLIVGGALVTGTVGAAGEIGHLVVNNGGEPCPCGQRGCLDLSASIPNVRRKIREMPERRDAVVAEAVESFGRALAPMASISGVSDIVISGPVDIVDSAFAAAVQANIRSRVFVELANTITVRTEVDAQHLLLTGAVAGVRASALGVA